MNDILELKGRFLQKKHPSPGSSNLPTGKCVTVEHLKELKNDLERVNQFWKNETLLIKPLVSAYYICVVAKSNRIKSLLSKGMVTASSSVVGAKFDSSQNHKHIITYCVSADNLEASINKLEKTINIVEVRFNGTISYDNINLINKNKIVWTSTDFAKTNFVNTVVDAYYLERFDIEQTVPDFKETTIVSLYYTGIEISKLMGMLKIDFQSGRSLDDTTCLLRPDQYEILKQKAPYLISMSVADISKLIQEKQLPQVETKMVIPSPKNEPTIGVIDTLFSKHTYFNEWVEFENRVDENIISLSSECNHGTKVTSIIVDGPALNPDLEDGCGRFRVKHFGVATGGSFSSFTVLREIKAIVAENKEIKVWNLSLGSALEINSNFISPEAFIIDQIQYENDVIFVIAGTNKNSKLHKDKQKIGAPADSINSLVVNSVDFNDNPATYSREGIVLSFFHKPDVCYYGGETNQEIWACSTNGKCKCCGTSFAAPWIARKLAYLINVLGLTREVAKALIIDSTTGWDRMNQQPYLMGFGVVPKHINDVVKSKNDEIRFVLSGVSEQYDTYNYNISVPVNKEKQPFVSKATLCYFPKCSRNQGVDYTNTELNFQFGRLNKNAIKTINDNKQGDESFYLLHEDDARTVYRKWDNVKHIGESLKDKIIPKKVYGNGSWGISIKRNERLNSKEKERIKFGIVITLKEMNGVNRIEEFIQQCSFRGWIVNPINVENRIDLYQKAEEEIEFDN